MIGTKKPRKMNQQQRRRRSWPEFSKKLRSSSKNRNPS
jgi:hypothetical protein